MGPSSAVHCSPLRTPNDAKTRKKKQRAKNDTHQCMATVFVFSLFGCFRIRISRLLSCFVLKSSAFKFSFLQSTSYCCPFPRSIHVCAFYTHIHTPSSLPFLPINPKSPPFPQPTPRFLFPSPRLSSISVVVIFLGGLCVHEVRPKVASAPRLLDQRPVQRRRRLRRLLPLPWGGK